MIQKHLMLWLLSVAVFLAGLASPSLVDLRKLRTDFLAGCANQGNTEADCACMFDN